MKLGLCMVALAIAGCSSAVHQEVRNVSEVVNTAPSDAFLTWCKNPESCFEGAAAFCTEDDLSGNSYSQHVHPGPWHQVAETDMAFPAMIQDHDGWRMWFACGEKHP